MLYNGIFWVTKSRQVYYMVKIWDFCQISEKVIISNFRLKKIASLILAFLKIPSIKIEGINVPNNLYRRIFLKNVKWRRYFFTAQKKSSFNPKFCYINDHKSKNKYRMNCSVKIILGIFHILDSCISQIKHPLRPNDNIFAVLAKNISKCTRFF